MCVLFAFFIYTMFVVAHYTFYSYYPNIYADFVGLSKKLINQSIHDRVACCYYIFKPRYIEIELRFLYTCGMSVTRPIAIGLIQRCISLHIHIQIYISFFVIAGQYKRSWLSRIFDIALGSRNWLIELSIYLEKGTWSFFAWKNIVATRCFVLSLQTGASDSL